MEVRFKVTIWEIHQVSDDEIVKKVKEGVIETSNDLCDEYGSNWEHDLETSEDMKPLENNGFPTIEIIDDNNDVVWQNGLDVEVGIVRRIRFFLYGYEEGSEEKTEHEVSEEVFQRVLAEDDTVGEVDYQKTENGVRLTASVASINY